MPVFTLQQDAVSEDGQEVITVGGTLYSNFYVGDDGGVNYSGGWIFDADNGTDSIPQGAAILTASITVNRSASPDYSAGFNGEWSGYDVDAVDAFTASHSHALTGHHAQTTARVTDNSWANNATHASPSLVSIIQEIVDRPSWPGGGEIGLVYEVTSGSGWWAFADNGASLTITWSTGGTQYSVSSTLSSASSTPDTPVPAVERSLTSAPTSASSTPDTPVLSIQESILSTVGSGSETPNTPVLAVERSVSSALASSSSTPDDAMLSVSGEITSTVGSQSTTPDTATLTVLRSVSSTMNSLSQTPNGAQLGVTLPTTSSLSSGSSTPDTSALAILRSFLSTATSASTTPDTAIVSVLRSILSAPVALSSTPDTALLDMRQPGSLEFFGGGNSSNVDKVYIPCASSDAVNVGQADFTIEMWVWVPSDLQDGGATAGANYSWIESPIVYDRDTLGDTGSGGDFGVSLTDGSVTFGLENSGGTNRTIVGTSDLRTNSWHHIAVTRARSSGDMAIFVDGSREALFSGGPGGDVHFASDSTQTGQNPYICIGGEKHELDWPQGQFVGLVADLRISSGIRYSGTTYAVPTSILVVDGTTLGLYHFNDGAGTAVVDSTTNVNDASFTVGGGSNGPQWSALTPYGGQTHSVSSLMVSRTTTPDDPIAEVARSLAATMTSQTSTSDTPVLSIIRSATSQASLQSVTPDTPTISLSMSMSSVASSESSTPDDTLLSLLASVISATSSTSSTPEDVILGIEGFVTLVSSLVSGSSTPDAEELSLSRSIQAAVNSASATPDGVEISLAKTVLSALSSVSITPNSAQLSLAFPMSSIVSSVSSTPDTPTLVVTRSLSSSTPSASSTTDAALLTLLMSIISTTNSQSTTPDTATLLTFIEGTQATGVARITFVGIKERSTVTESTITIQGV